MSISQLSKCSRLSWAVILNRLSTPALNFVREWSRRRDLHISQVRRASFYFPILPHHVIRITPAFRYKGSLSEAIDTHRTHISASSHKHHNGSNRCSEEGRLSSMSVFSYRLTRSTLIFTDHSSISLAGLNDPANGINVAGSGYTWPESEPKQVRGGIWETIGMQWSYLLVS